MKVSVAVVTYNHEKYIKQCLDGILMQQTDFDYEVVIGEDSGTDKTLSICEEYAKQYPQIIILPKQERLGIGQNWMRVLKACSGDYIAFCEGDDYWINPQKLQKQVKYLDAHPECSMCYTDCDIYYEDAKRIEKNIVRNEVVHIDSINPIRAKGYQCNVTWMFRRGIVKKLHFEKDCVDCTLPLLYECYLSGSIYGLQISTGVYRRHLGSASFDDTNSDKMYEFFKGSFLLKDVYVMRFPNGEYERFNLYWSIMLMLYDKALEKKDDDFLNLIDSYFSGHIRELLLFVRTDKNRISTNRFTNKIWKCISKLIK